MRNSLRYAASMALGGVIVAALLVATGAYAQNVPQEQDSALAPVSLEGVVLVDARVQYQGQLLDVFTGQPLTNGVYPMTFRIYNVANGGSPLWSEAKNVTVTDGLFTTQLGDSTPLNLGDFNGQTLWLGVQVSSDAETTPRQPISHVPYAIYAENAKLFDGRDYNTIGASFVPAKRGPVSFGVVDENGSRVKGYHFSSTRTSTGVYRIEIKDENENKISYNLNEFVTLVTAIDNSTCPFAKMTGTASQDGYLLVDIFDANGGLVNCKFHFITFKP